MDTIAYHEKKDLEKQPGVLISNLPKMFCDEFFIAICFRPCMYLWIVFHARLVFWLIKITDATIFLILFIAKFNAVFAQNRYQCYHV